MSRTAPKWEDSFTLLGINIDNKFQCIDANFEKVHFSEVTNIPVLSRRTDSEDFVGSAHKQL